LPFQLGFLNSAIADGEPELWRDVEVAAFKRRHPLDLLKTEGDPAPHRRYSRSASQVRLAASAIDRLSASSVAKDNRIWTT
jgi:hypothetical protein